MNETINDFFISKKKQFDEDIKNYEKKLLEYNTITLSEYENQKKDILNEKNSLEERFNNLTLSRKNIINLKNNYDKEIISLNKNLDCYIKEKKKNSKEITSKSDLLINEILEKIKQNNIKINLLRVEIVKSKENNFSKNNLKKVNMLLESKKKKIAINNSIKNSKEKIKSDLELLEFNSKHEKKNLNKLFSINQSEMENNIKKINEKLEVLTTEYKNLTFKIKHLNNNISVLERDNFNNKEKILNEKRTVLEKLEQKSEIIQNEYLKEKKELKTIQNNRSNSLKNYNLNCIKLNEKYTSERNNLISEFNSYQKKPFKKLNSGNTYVSINKNKESIVNDIIQQNLALNQSILTKKNILKMKLNESDKKLKNQFNVEIIQDTIKNLNLENDKLNNELLNSDQDLNKLSSERENIDNILNNLNLKIINFVKEKNSIIELKQKKINEMNLFEKNYHNYLLKLETDVNHLNIKEREKQEKKQIIKNKILKYEKELNRLN